MLRNDPNPLFNFLTERKLPAHDMRGYYSQNNLAAVVPGSRYGYSGNEHKTYLYYVGPDVSTPEYKQVCPGRFTSYLSEDEKLAFAKIVDELLFA